MKMKYNMGGEVPTYAGMPMMAEGGVVPKKKKVSKKKSIDGIARQGGLNYGTFRRTSGVYYRRYTST